jgi:hypothetical protein
MVLKPWKRLQAHVISPSRLMRGAADVEEANEVVIREGPQTVPLAEP